MKDLLSQFYVGLDQNVQSIWSIQLPSEHLLSLVGYLQKLCAQVNDIGLAAQESLDIEGIISQEIKIENTFIHYEWIREAKSFLVLWRDTIFQYQKGLILKEDEEVTELNLDHLKILSKEKIVEAATYLKDYSQNIAQINASQKVQDQYLQEKALRTNPWAIYRQQLKTLKEQSLTLIDQHNKILVTKTSLDRVKESILDVSSKFDEELARIRYLGHKAIDYIEHHMDEGPEKITEYIESIEKQALAYNHYTTYDVNTSQLIKEMTIENLDIPIDLMNGQLRYRKINFVDTLQVWLEAELQPLIREAQDILEGVGNGMRMVLTNAKNRASLMKLEENTPDKSTVIKEICQPLTLVLETFDGQKKELLEYQGLIQSRLTEHLKITHLYDTHRRFLDTAQQYKIGQINIEETAWLQTIKNWIVERAGFARGFMDIVAREEKLSVSEKIVRYVKSRRNDEDNSQYSNIFSAEGYIGESFWVGRKSTIAHAEQLIDNWKAGFRGSVVLSGMRFSGKTVFGEIIAHRHFLHRTIRLIPHSKLEINGHAYKVGDDIDKALKFVKRRTGKKKYLIWIDDLESWQGPNIQASTNVAALINHIDTLSARLFFMVSMSNWFKHHYDQMLQMNKVFQSEVNLDEMTEEGIREAIMIRHGATHKLLVDEQGAQVPPDKFAQLVHRITRQTDNNIGQTLNDWSYFTHRLNDEQVVHRPELNFELPDFINDENSILLRVLLMKKRSNEYSLRKTLGIAFRDKYQTIIKRLKNLGVIVESIDGHIEINEGIVNDVAAMLADARYLKYSNR